MKRETHRKYQDKLRDPRWLEFRKEVLSQSKFTDPWPNQPYCEYCSIPEERAEIQVHHCGYVEGREPWNYSFDEVIVLCRTCHEDLHAFADAVWNQLLKCRNKWDIYECAKKIRDMRLDRHLDEEFENVV